MSIAEDRPDLKIQPIMEALEEEESEKFLLYGPPGFGKTQCALTLPEPIVVIAIGGVNETKTYTSKKFQDVYGKREIYVGTAREQLGSQGRVDTPEGYDNACLLIDKALEEDASGERPFKSLVIDNATVLSEYQMYKAIYMAYGKAKPEKRADTTYIEYINEGLLFPFDSDWGPTQSLMRKFISWLFRIDKNIAFVAHEYHEESTDRSSHLKKLIGVKPLFIGKDRDMVANAFDNVWHFEKNGQFFAARTEAQGQDPETIAKSRVGGIIPRIYNNPDLSETIEKYKAHQESLR